MINTRSLLVLVILGLWLPARPAPLNNLPTIQPETVESNTNSTIQLSNGKDATVGSVKDLTATLNASKADESSELTKNEEVHKVEKDGSTTIESIKNKINGDNLNTNLGELDVIDKTKAKTEMSQLNMNPSALSLNPIVPTSNKPLLSNTQRVPITSDAKLSSKGAESELNIDSYTPKNPIVYDDEKDTYGGYDSYNIDSYAPKKPSAYSDEKDPYNRYDSYNADEYNDNDGYDSYKYDKNRDDDYDSSYDYKPKYNKRKNRHNRKYNYSYGYKHNEDCD
ncbi:hypothetical protein K502DRAFT_333459 [Neoconidiobolus thromboides FSU 785]|nr:hypothetical protein K502DRAFT_333459 [Neoconidiobolus thromboides FSU 785]